MSRLDRAEIKAAKAFTSLFKTTEDFLKVLGKFFFVPKTQYGARMWRDVQLAFWSFWSLVITTFFLIPQLVKYIR